VALDAAGACPHGRAQPPSHQQLGRLQAHPAFRQRMLDRLVLADRPGEHDAFSVVRVTSTIFLACCVVEVRTFRERSVTRAAASLNLTQSAVSHALRRLRESVRDRLFERHGTALVPTPLMKSLAQPLNDSLRSLEQVVNSGNQFEPSAAARCFVVGMDERLELFALPSFIERMMKIAPNLFIRMARGRTAVMRERTCEFDADTIEAALAHVVGGVRGVYLRSAFFPERQALKASSGR
jgi:hypothetical protein